MKKKMISFVTMQILSEPREFVQTSKSNSWFFVVFYRIIFFDSNGNVLKNVQNPSRDDYVYFYEQESDVIASMNQAIAVNNAN